MRIRTAITYTISALALGAATALGLATSADDAPRKREQSVEVVDLHCPQEDSCDVDYRDGRWYVYQTNR
jgi:hypothetical protein